MEEAKIISEQETTLTPGDNEIPTLRLGESGYSGLTVLGGQVFEDCQWELRWPQAGETFKKMAKDGAIAPALELVEMMIARVPWSVKIPEGYEDQLKDKAVFMQQVLEDMEHDFMSAIRQAVTFNRYGFSILEKVYRYRTKENGSKYNDGLIGIKKLASRSADTVDKWKWKNQGRELAGFYQDVVIPEGGDYSGWDFVNTTTSAKLKFIPRKKFLLFRNNPLKDSPTGVSPLVGCWQAWKYKQAYLEAEAISVAQEANAFKVLFLPPQYMKEDATPEDKAVFDYYKNIMKSAHLAKESGVILPLVTDENGNKLFDFDIKSVSGTKSYDINAIIARYNAEILTCLFADFLSLGSNGSGSFSLAESKVSIIEMAIESKLNEIKSQLNHDLARQLFELNGWDTDVMPVYDYGQVSKESIDEIGKFIQRVSAVGMMPKTPEVVNWVMRQADIPYRADPDKTPEELAEELTPNESRAGDGMKSGMGNGTGDSSGGSGDSSISNTENT